MINHLKKALVLLPFLVINCIQAQHTDVINSNRPGASQSAFSVGQTVFQAETGIYGITEEHTALGTKTDGFGAELALRYGAFFEQLEFNVETKYQFDKTNPGALSRNDFKNLTIGAKYLVYDPYKNYEEKINILSWKANHKFNWKQFIPAVAVYAGANFSVANEDYAYPNEPTVSPKIMVIAQNHFGTSWVFMTNIYYDKFTSDYKSLGYVVTLTRGFNEKWSGFIENQGFDSDYYTDSFLRGGAAYLISSDLQIDASVSTNFKDTPSLFSASVGISWRIDEKYEPIKIEIGDGKDKRSGKKKKKDKKEKKESKKRLDEVEG